MHIPIWYFPVFDWLCIEIKKLRIFFFLLCNYMIILSYFPRRIDWLAQSMWSKTWCDSLNAKLNDEQKEMFLSSCFGHFLQNSEIRIQHPIIHKLLMLKIRQPNENENEMFDHITVTTFHYMWSEHWWIPLPVIFKTTELWMICNVMYSSNVSE